MSIKLLFVIDGLFLGGKERQLTEIINGLKQYNNIQTIVITFSKEQFYTEIVKKQVNKLYEIGYSNNFIRLMKTLKIIRSSKPDIVYSWDTMSSFFSYISTRFSNIKFVDGSIRDTGVEKGFEYQLKKFLLKNSDLVISNSFAGLKAYGVTGKVLYNAININRFKEQNSEEFNIIMLANFSDYKDHKTYINASEILAEKNLIDNIFLAGSGKHFEKYKNHIKTLPKSISSKFIFLGKVSNIENYLLKCKIGVLCSTIKYGEGISNSILEYMAAGLIPIATDIGATNEIIINEENGFLISENSHQQIVSIVENLRYDNKLIKKIKFNAINTVKNKFNYNKNIEKFVTIIKSLKNNTL
ncbi:MAG: glycosyltransferase [Bacteroidales bacterium]|nr:glycosyltransferase [Bacteroidales bacterium]